MPESYHKIMVYLFIFCCVAEVMTISGQAEPGLSSLVVSGWGIRYKLVCCFTSQIQRWSGAISISVGARHKQ